MLERGEQFLISKSINYFAIEFLFVRVFLRDSILIGIFALIEWMWEAKTTDDAAEIIWVKIE